MRPRSCACRCWSNGSASIPSNGCGCIARGADDAMLSVAATTRTPRTNMTTSIRTANPTTMAAPGGHYSHAVAAGGLVFVSGQLPIAPDGTKLNESSFEQQAQQVLENVAHAL